MDENTSKKKTGKRAKSAKSAKPGSGSRKSPRKSVRVVEPKVDPGARLQEALEGFFLKDEEAAFAGGLAVRNARHEDEREYLSFRLADEIFGVDIEFIREIIKPPAVTPVPRTEPIILGVFSMRGDILPLVDLRRLLHLEESPGTRASRVLVLDLPVESVGLLVDEVRHVVRLTEDSIEPPPAVFGRMEAEHLLGVGRYEEEMIILIDLREAVRLEPYVRR